MTADASHSFELARPDSHVAGQCVQTRGPLVLPSNVCARCGSNEPGGTIHREVVTYFNPWWWMTVFISWLITWIAYLSTRKRVQVQYYLCPKCADRRKIGSLTGTSVSVIALVGMAFTLWMGSSMMFTPFAVALGVGWLGRIVFARSPLRALEHQDGVFLLTGASREVLSAMDRKQLTDAHDH